MNNSEIRQRAENWKKGHKLKPLIKLKRPEMAYHIGILISDILGRKVNLVCNTEESDFWAVASKDVPFSAKEIAKLLRHVGINDSDMVKDAMPEDRSFSKELGMELSQKLFEKVINSSWEIVFVSEDDIWLLGVNEFATLPEVDKNIYFIDNTSIDSRKLFSKDEIIKHLTESHSIYEDLVDICNRYVKDFGNELYWHYPISDGNHNGVYFVMVKEGVLCLPYNEVTESEDVRFILEDVKLCSAQEIRYFIFQLKKDIKYLMGVMNEMSDITESMEV